MQEEDKDQTARRRSEDQQDRRALMKQTAAAQQGGDNHQNQPQKCPRCDSYNTKFCYYNNYSLSQPRYFCKTCRRYWTQGGTLRNVPVGGGCRKGKRTKTTTTSAVDNSRPQTPQLPPPHVQPTTGSALRIKEPADNSNLATSSVPTMNSYYQGGGFLSSLAAIQSLNNQTQSFSQQTPVNVGGGGFGGSSSTSNMALLQGFHNVPNFGSQQQHHHHQIHQGDQFYQMGGIKGGSQETFLIQPTSGNRTSTTGSSHQNWPHQSFINNTANIPTAPSHGGLWNISSSTTNSNAAGSSLNQLNQWPDHHLPGYDPPS